MLDSKALPHLKRKRSVLDLVATGMVLVAVALGLGAYIMLPFNALRWMQTPFIGAFVEHTMHFNESGPTGEHPWMAQALGVGLADQLMQINGQPVTNAAQMQRVLSGYQPGDQVLLGIRSTDGSLRTLLVTLQTLPVTDRISYFFLPYLIGLIYLTSAVWVFVVRRHTVDGRAFTMAAVSLAVFLGAFFDTATTHVFTVLWTAAVAMVGAGMITIGLYFPVETVWAERIPWLHWLGYALGGAGFLYAYSTLYSTSRPLAYVETWRLLFIFSSLGTLFFLGMMIYQRYRAESPIAREQARLSIFGAVLSFGPLVTWVMGDIFFAWRFSPYLLLFAAIFPASMGYNILRYRFFSMDVVLSRSALYVVLTVLAVSGYALIVSGLSLVAGRQLNATNPYVIGILVFLLAVLLQPMRLWLQERIDRVFFRGQAAFRTRTDEFTRQVTQIMDSAGILDLLRTTLEETFSPAYLHIFLYDSLIGMYLPAADKAGRPTTDLRFSPSSGLVEYLAAHRRQAFFLRGRDSIPLKLQNEQARLALLRSLLFVPLSGREDLLGWIGLGECRSGEPYTSNDITFLESISAQVSLAIERAHVVADLERRVHEMDVLARISQGVNVTLNLDDIFELVYAQTTRLIPARDFWILLTDRFAEVSYYAFYLDNDDRIEARENKPLPEGRGLEQIILRSGQALRTTDYELECRNQGVLPSVEGIFAWMGVPLNAGADTIGALSIASRDLSTAYTDEQMRLLQSIADQAAGAIVKSRLLLESEQRARQLSTLNEVARNLGSTLELDPLLDRVMHSAVTILNCEAGSLFLVDEETGELVFDVTIGPVAGNLVGQRLPPGTGLVGKAVITRQPVIANDVLRTKDWFDKADEQTGFRTEALLVVPMIVKDDVVGVIEVINKRNGMPFTVEDQELLMAFAGQAAVAYENARLYTMTDQALTARVEELSVMQRIDRELNASLDVRRAMRITLSWAMRQAGSDAGLIGVLEEDGLRIMASEGYQSELKPYERTYYPVDTPTLKEAIESGQPQWFVLGKEHVGILLEAKNQMVAPIRREAQVVGLIVLESVQEMSTQAETASFIARLVDHAAIAISNAQLYSAVEQANRAKSEFVSMVSHELKTPMTSIRGYTDLLLAGAVGPVNDAQTNFLNTIRFNIERMQVLVSDLADVARIEAGRLSLSFGTVAIGRVVQEVTRSAQAQIDAKKQHLFLEIPEDLPPVWGDQGRLIQILTNLVSNANKYSPVEGSIYITAEQAVNQWDPEGAPNVVHVAVRDTGFGIKEEDQHKIFSKFFRAEDEEIRNAPGTGLGLNITKTLIEMQGGKIWFESQFRKGTTFHFTIPVAETTQEAQ
ncbi:MAG: hypothetical protein Fur0018_06370 [Anaerolineales bacterium]